MSGSSTISTSETRLEALQFQSSAYGVVLPVVYGVTRIPGNLMWYGGFKAIPTTTVESQGGKGGGIKTSQTTFKYTAAVMMGLCEGDIAGVAQVWRGKTLYQGGVSPTQVITTTQNYTVPGGGGSIAVTNAATFAAEVSVVAPTGGGEAGTSPYQLSEGNEYTRIGGTYTFAAGPLVGQTVVITYQYTVPGALQTSLQQLGLSLAKGAVGQSVWSFLTASFPAQALGYSGIAYVYSSAYDLGSSAQIENHNFEVQAQLAYSVSSSIPDADPSQVGYDITTNYRYGVAGFPSTKLGSTGTWSAYCRAAGLFMSPAFTEQDSAASVLKKLTDMTNTALVWSEGVLKFVPYGDAALTGNGSTYTPNTTPLYDLTDDHFLDKEVPVRMKRKPQSDAYNQIRIEFLNRANQYNIEIAEAKDQANIDTYGLRCPEVIKAHWICDATIARTVAQLMLQRSLYIRNTYEFKLSWNFVLLEPMDLVTLTDSVLGLSKFPVRITEVSEDADGELALTAEDFPQGSATATLYPTQAGAGYAHNYNVSPGVVSAPTIFEAPGALTQNGLELYIAATGLDPNWGGCQVWVSLDGSNYKQVGVINGGSRYGTLNAAAAASGNINVTLLKGALISGSAADAAALNTLCYIGGANREFVAYQTATLGGALQYTLSSNVRGAYSTPAASHSIGDPFVRIDAGIAKSGVIDLGYIGKTVRVKLPSFNIYGGAQETLATAVEYTYTITGVQLLGNAGAAALQGITNAASDNILTAGEKPPIILEYSVLTAEQTGIGTQATNYGITTEKTTYDTSLSTLATYLGTLTSPVAWNNLTGDTTIVGTTFRSNFQAVYAARQALLNKITDIANSKLATRTNMLANGGFEQGIGNWSGITAAGMSVVDGTWGRIVARFTAFSGTGTINSDPVPVQPGETYTVTGDSMLFATSGQVYFDILFYDVTLTTLLLDGGQNPLSPHDFSATDSWRNAHAVSSVAPASAAFAVVRFVWSSIVGGTAMGCRQIKLERGGLPATAYTNDTGLVTAFNAASAAQTSANNAQTSANTANTALTNIASDSILSPSEKPSVVQDYAVIIGEQSGIDAQATALSITTEKTTYDNAVSALTSYLGGLTGWNTVPGSDVAIVGTTFRSNFAAVYTARQALLNKISDVLNGRLTTRPNLLVNGGLERGYTSWTPNANFSLQNSVWGRTLVTASIASGSGNLESDKFAVTAGATYTVTGDSLRFGTSGDVYFVLAFYNASNVFISYGGTGILSTNHDFQTDDSNRRAHAVASVAPAGAAFASAIFAWASLVGCTALGFRQVKVERGGLPATPYTADTADTNITTQQLNPNAATDAFTDQQNTDSVASVSLSSAFKNTVSRTWVNNTGRAVTVQFEAEIAGLYYTGGSGWLLGNNSLIAQWVVEINGTPVLAEPFINTAGQQLLDPNTNNRQRDNSQWAYTVNSGDTIKVYIQVGIDVSGGGGTPTANWARTRLRLTTIKA